MADGDDLRRIALSLPGVSEAPHFDRLAFRAARIFTTLAADRRSANIKFSPDEQQLKCLVAPEAFTPLKGGWGERGWTRAELSALDEGELRSAVEAAFRHGQAKTRAPRNPRKGRR
jgi:hypothetical protein